MIHKSSCKQQHEILFMVAGLGLATPAASQDVWIAGREFVAAWKTLIGQTVQITGGRVYGARLRPGYLSLEGGSVVLFPPFSQGELRYRSSSPAPLIGAGHAR